VAPKTSSRTSFKKTVLAAPKRDRSEDLFGPPDIRTSLPMEFLWYPYLPFHCVSILAGNPGMGKSLLIAQIVAIVTAGLNWPLSSDRAKPGKVLLLSGEDSWSRVTLRRLEQARADINKIEVMRRFKALDEDTLEALESKIRELRPPLVIIDTLSLYMGGARDMHRQNEVGEFLGRLNDLAEETGCAVLGVGHLNKQGGQDPLFRMVGSIGFLASARSVLFLGSDPADPSKVALAHAKANGSSLGPTISFERSGGSRDQAPQLIPVATIDADYVTVCEPVSKPRGRPRSESDDAEEFILDYLTTKPTPWAELWNAADGRNIASKPTFDLVRARLKEQGTIQQVGKGPKAKWRLAESS
jgi:AAA domain